MAMLGAVVALRRGEHAQTAIVGMVSPAVRAFLDVLAIAAALVFLCSSCILPTSSPTTRW
jgi:TRAP-type C4-dicarboxylate transport system permease small subunit